MENKLDKARKIINEVDSKMAELFVERMRAAEMVYEHKKEFGLPILDQARENAVIEKNIGLIEDDVLKGYYIDFLKNTMSISRAYQYRMQNGLKVAYSGVEGAFAHIAAGRIFPEGNRISCRDFKAAYDSVVSGENDVAVLPIENSYAGEVGQTIDLIFSGTLFVNGIYELEIKQNLLGVPGAAVEDIEKVIVMKDGKTDDSSNSVFSSKYIILAIGAILIIFGIVFGTMTLRSVFKLRKVSKK